ncbi:MAG: HAMP domain-containing histidine kinase [Actinobacteria bacterium]|nr:HAMP domain-containing histidine kinase [Actinomycetota bacterium]
MPRRSGQWLLLLRAAVAVVAIVTVAVTDIPPAYEPWAWAVTAFFVAATLLDGIFAFLPLTRAQRVRARALAIVGDAIVGIGYVAVFSYQAGQPYRALYLIPIAEVALRYGLRGALPVAAIMVGATIAIDDAQGPLIGHVVAVRILVALLIGLVIGRLKDAFDEQRRVAETRAAEAEALRDQLGRRVDVLEAASRCARALASSLELDEAFGAFIRELRGLVPFERTAIVLVDGEEATTMATAGRGADRIFPPGSVGPLHGSVLERVLDGQLVVRRDLGEVEYPEDELLIELGLRSELVAPLLVGARAIGMLSLARERVDAFSEDEIELVALLGRFVATAVQNIRSYEAERARVAELRRLSDLRADFVSLVSHELRSPMAAVIGAARTLQDRWRVLSADQREAFLALIGDETSRLAALIGDVLDTSRIEAGTFSYRFDDVDLGRIVHDAVDTAGFAQQDVSIEASVPAEAPRVRCDRERLRQVLGNLIENAVKYSPEGGTVQVRLQATNGVCRISVSDQGPGIPHGQQQRIFEKFGRADVPGVASKPGSGLGLFIARSIAEAHGGTLDVRSRPDEGATFTLTLPVAA